MKRFLLGLTAPVLAVALLAGCGGGEDTAADASKESTSPSPSPSAAESPSGSTADAEGAGTKYCELLATDFATLFANMRSPEDVENAVDMIRQIAQEAPPEIEDDWAAMEGALDQMKATLMRAADLQKKAEAGEITQKQLQKQSQQLMEEMQALDTPANNKAGDAVAKHASEYCGVNLG